MEKETVFLDPLPEGYLALLAEEDLLLISELEDDGGSSFNFGL